MEYPASGEEITYRLLDEVGGLNEVCMVRFRGLVEPEAFRDAMTQLQRRHPMLRMGFVRGRWALTDEGLPAVPFRVVERQSATQWEPEYENEMATRFEDHMPMWRLTLFLGRDVHDLILTAHHAMADGLSVRNLTAELLALVDRRMRGESISLEFSPLRGKAHELYEPTRRGFLAFLRQVRFLADLFIHLCAYRPKRLKSAVQPPAPGARPRALHATMAAETHGRLQARCQIEGVSVQTAFSTAILRAVARRLRTQADPFADVDVLLSTPLNTRWFLNPGATPNDVGMYSVNVVSWHRLQEDIPFWDGARIIRREFIKVARRSDNVTSVGILDKLSARRQHLSTLEKKMLYDARGFAAVVSNLGSGPHIFGNLVVEEGRGLACNLPTFTMVWMVITELHGALFLELGFPEPYLQESDMRRFFAEILEEVQAACA